MIHFLAHRIGIEPEACEVARFNLEQCREAWRQLRGVTFADVRNWVATYRGTKRAAAAQAEGAAA